MTYQQEWNFVHFVSVVFDCVSVSQVYLTAVGVKPHLTLKSNSIPENLTMLQ